jgi:ABC-type nitrate/sulfonate/bicarbonate transport system permease component
MKDSAFGRDLWASWAGFITLLLVWQLISTMKLINPAIFPGPMGVVEAALKDVPLNRLLQHIGISLFRVALGFSIGTAAGIIIGVASGWYYRLGSILRTPIELIRPIPPLAWIPIAIIWLGLGEPSKILIIFLGAFFPVVTNTYKGMVNIDPNIIRAAQILGLRGRRLLLRIAVPAALPDIATGMRIGWSYSFGCMVAAELIAAKSGLGYLIMNARQTGQIAVIVYGVILIGVINLVTDFVIQEVVIKRRLKWQFLETA